LENRNNRAFEGLLRGFWAGRWISSGGPNAQCNSAEVTTFALLAFVMFAEVRGEPTVHVLNRRLPASVQRQALTVALAGAGLVMVSTVTLLAISPFGLDAVLFETLSAFGTVRLSTGITDDLSAPGQLVLTALMFLGRLGPITLASALPCANADVATNSRRSAPSLGNNDGETADLSH
jgi:Trk-type K+ transport system membrane component